MKVRKIRPQADDEYTAERFLIVGRTPEELAKECDRIGVTKVGDSYVVIKKDKESIITSCDVDDGDWIVKWGFGVYVYTDESFHKTFDTLRSYVKWDPSKQYGQLLQAMHLVMELEEGKATHTFHPMAWGLFRQCTIQEFFRYPELSEWAPEMASQWEKCNLCTNGKIRLTEEDYKDLGEDRLIPAFEVEEDKTPHLASHTFCKVCGGLGYKYIGVKK